MTIVAAQSVSRLLPRGGGGRDARRERVDATDGATRYLVALLADYAHPGQPRRGGARPAADAPPRRGAPRARPRPSASSGCGSSATASSTAAASSATTSRRAGVDAQLPPRPRHAGVRRGELDAPAGAARRRAPDLFGELADEVRRASSRCWPRSPTRPSRWAPRARSGLLKVYERWLKTGSDRLAERAHVARRGADARDPGRPPVSRAPSASSRPKRQRRRAACASGRSPAACRRRSSGSTGSTGSPTWATSSASAGDGRARGAARARGRGRRRSR